MCSPRWSASPTTEASPARASRATVTGLIRAGAVVLATGAFERPLVFPGNDRPGVMLAGAAERYANEFGVVVGDKAVVFTNNDSAYRAAAALAKAGGGVTTIVDVRAEISPAARSLAAEAGAELLTGHAIVGTEGGKAVSARQGAALRCGDAARCPATSAPSLPTAVLVSGGWSPVIHLASQAGGKPHWNAEVQAFVPPEPTQNWIGAGAFLGRFSTAEALAQGHAAGIAATGAPETPVYLPDVSTHGLDPRPARGASRSRPRARPSSTSSMT